MTYNELLDSNFRDNLVSEIQSIDLSSCSNDELATLRMLASELNKSADASTLEDEIVGYTYSNLHALYPKISKEESKRGLVFIKKR